MPVTKLPMWLNGIVCASEGWVKRMLLIVLSLLFLLSCSTAFGANPFEYEVSPEEVPKFHKPITIHTESGTQLFDGQYRSVYKIPLPPARGGLAPRVILEYASDAAESPIGRGWSLSVDNVRRSLRNGVPAYVGPGSSNEEDEFLFSIDGQTGSLTYIGKDTVTGEYLYRPRREGLFGRFYFNAATSSWRVLHSSGKVWVLGSNATRDVDPEQSSRIYAWYVATISDADGNQIRYSYQQANGVLAPTRIEYDHSTALPITSSQLVDFPPGRG